jgi:glycosyltransferase involved in cell wall biosynthesis
MTAILTSTKPGTTGCAPLKVAHLCAGNLYGGVETVLATICRYERAEGLQSRFVVGWDGRQSERLRALGAQVDLVGGARLSRPWQVLQVRRRIRSLLKTNRPDVAVVHSGWTQWVMGPAAVAEGIPLVLWVHNELPPKSLLHQLARRVKPSDWIGNSRFTADTIPAWYPSAVPKVIYCPVPAPLPVASGSRDSMRSALGATTETFVILQASRLQDWKGHRHLLKALSALKSRTEWVWWIAGGAQRPEEEQHKSELMREAGAAGLADRIRWLGHRDDLPLLLDACDVYAQINSTPEPLGLVFIEAMYAGRPVLCANSGGIAEIVDDSCGRRVTPGDAAVLTRTLESWMKDPSEPRRLGARGPECARRSCDPEVQMRTIAARLRKVAETVSR